MIQIKNILNGRRDIKIPGWLFIAAISILTGCGDKHQDPTDRPAFVISDSLLKTIQIDSVMECPLINALSLTGKVSYNEENVSKVFPLVSGIISDIKVQSGDYVQKGQTLGIIRSAEMAGFANDLVTANTNLVNAKKNLDASEEMYKTGLIAERDMVAAKSSYEQAEAQVTKATNVLNIMGGNTQSEFVVKAPVSGFIVDKQVTNNTAIRTDMASSLFTISDLKNVWVWANVYESNISRVHQGDEVQVTTLSYPDRIFMGKIDKIVNVLDPTNKVMKVRTVLANPDYALKPEMFATVNVTNKSNTQSLCVPSSALIFDHSQYFVLLYNRNSDVRITPVQVLSKYGNKTFINGTLRQDDRVISSNTVLIYQALNG